MGKHHQHTHPVLMFPSRHPLHHTIGAQTLEKRVSGSQPYWRGAAKHSGCQGFSEPWQCQGEQQGSHKKHTTLQPCIPSELLCHRSQLAQQFWTRTPAGISAQSPATDFRCCLLGQQQKVGVANKCRNLHFMLFESPATLELQPMWLSEP